MSRITLPSGNPFPLPSLGTRFFRGSGSQSIPHLTQKAWSITVLFMCLLHKKDNAPVHILTQLPRLYSIDLAGFCLALPLLHHIITHSTSARRNLYIIIDLDIAIFARARRWANRGRTGPMPRSACEPGYEASSGASTSVLDGRSV